MRRLIAMLALPLLAGCADLGYYWHSAAGHIDILKYLYSIVVLAKKHAPVWVSLALARISHPADPHSKNIRQ